MEILKTDGIVLNSKVIGDSDIFCKILTKDFGKKKFIFKGLKKSRKREKAAAEPGTLISLIYYYRENKEINIVNEFNIQNQYSEIRDNLQKIFHLYYLLEIVEKTTGLEDVNKIFFELLNAGIDTLSKTEYNINLTVFFIIHLLRFQGILPDFRNCRNCGTEIVSNFSLSFSDLNPICHNCSKSNSKLLDHNSRKFIILSLSNKFHSINHDEFDQVKFTNLLFYLSLFIEGYYNIEIRSKEFILSKKYL